MVTGRSNIATQNIWIRQRLFLQMIRYTIFVKWLFWTIFPVTFLIGFFVGDQIENYDLYYFNLTIIMGIILLPILLVRCKNCKAFVYGKWYFKYGNIEKIWEPENNLKKCPNCAKNPLETEG